MRAPGLDCQTIAEESPLDMDGPSLTSQAFSAGLQMEDGEEEGSAGTRPRRMTSTQEIHSGQGNEYSERSMEV